MQTAGKHFILGLTYFGNHESSAVLLENGEVVAAAEEERFTRIKFDRSFPSKSIEFCLKYAGINIHKIEHVGFFWQPWRGIGKRIFYAIGGLPDSLTRASRNVGVLFDLLSAERIFRQKTGFKGRFHFLDHHLTHAASSYFSSDLDKTAILSIDGTGETTTCWLGEANGANFKNYQTTKWPHSLGNIYSAATQYLGFKIFEDEYKIMSLAAYGKPEYLNDFRKIIKTKDDGSFEINLDYTDYQYFKKRWYSDKWLKTFGPSRTPDKPLEKHHKDLAASLQRRIEEVLEELARFAIRRSGVESLCLSGGVALNSLAVGKLARSGICRKIFTNPVSGDAGCALGAAYYLHNVILGNKRNSPLEHAFFGSQYSKGEIETALKQSGLNYEAIDDPSKKAAELIVQGRIIGWFQGRTEFGQRALGNRSILADPRDKDIKEKINSKIKRRESFRPFAPAILEEFQREYFDWKDPVPFMTEIHPVKETKRGLIPAVTHVDGTARLQTVSRKINPLFWNLIHEFHKLTGIPVILNTSFNAGGEPIVNSPEDAIGAFSRIGLDYMIIGNFLIRKQ